MDVCFTINFSGEDFYYYYYQVIMFVASILDLYSKMTIEKNAEQIIIKKKKISFPISLHGEKNVLQILIYRNPTQKL